MVCGQWLVTHGVVCGRWLVTLGVVCGRWLVTHGVVCGRWLVTLGVVCGWWLVTHEIVVLQELLDGQVTKEMRASSWGVRQVVKIKELCGGAEAIQLIQPL